MNDKKTTDGRLPSSQAFDHLVYLRVFEGCNLHCLHCFIPSNPKKMTLEDIAKVPDMLRAKIAPGSKVLLQWHGGEPTLMGPDFIRKSIEVLREMGPEFDWRFGIQTNLMTYDSAWANLYREEFGGEVGISWDPKIRLMNRRATDSNPEFNKKFDGRLAELVSDGLKPYVVTTATKSLFAAFRNPFDFFQHWTDRGVRHVHLERVTETGYARSNWGIVGLSNAEYSENMARWMKAYHSFLRSQNGPTRLHLSPFENITDSVTSLSDGTPRSHGCWSGDCDTKFHTIDAGGYKFGCTALTSEQDNKKTNEQLDLGSDLATQRELRTYDCHKCSFRSICSSGCLALSFDDGSGECSGGFNLFETARLLQVDEKSSERRTPPTADVIPRLKNEACK
jgi:radical SAM protein with 4Fe4S-binding SPASM domain